MREKIVTAIALLVKEEPADWQNSKDLAFDIGLNSINRMRLLLALEQVFDVQFNPEKISISVFDSLDQLEEFVREALTEKAQNRCSIPAAHHD